MSPSGHAFEAIADEGRYAYLVTSLGRARSVDGADGSDEAVTTAMGDPLAAAAVFNDELEAELKARADAQRMITTR